MQRQKIVQKRGAAAFEAGHVEDRRDADRANCAFDLRHIFNLSLVAMTPHFRGNRAAQMLLNNWQIAPIISELAD